MVTVLHNVPFPPFWDDIHDIPEGIGNILIGDRGGWFWLKTADTAIDGDWIWIDEPKELWEITYSRGKWRCQNVADWYR